MSKAPSPGRQRLPVKEEGDQLVLYPKKAQSGAKAAVDMSKQIGHFHDEGKHDADEGNVLKLSPRPIKLCVPAVACSEFEKKIIERITADLLVSCSANH